MGGGSATGLPRDGPGSDSQLWPNAGDAGRSLGRHDSAPRPGNDRRGGAAAQSPRALAAAPRVESDCAGVPGP